MRNTTKEAMQALLRTDATIGPEDRARIMGAVRDLDREAAKATAAVAPREPRVLVRAEVARKFGRSLRFVDKLAVQGVLRRVKLPGRQRSCGFLAEEVERVMIGEGGAA